MLVVKIYEGDKAEDILANLINNKDLELDEEDITNIERESSKMHFVCVAFDVSRPTSRSRI